MPEAGLRVANALAQVNRIGFPEFTSKLITDTCDSIVAATLKQIKSFVELVKELDAGADAFKAKVVNDGSINKFLADAWPASGASNTAIVSGGSYNHKLWSEITSRLGNIDGFTDPGAGTATFSEVQVTAIKNKVKDALNAAADQTFQHLKTMVELGYARVVFTEGRILSRLTFEVDASDSSARQTSDYAYSAFSASASIGGGVVGWLSGISGRSSYNNVHVSTVNSQVASTDKSIGQILGEVEVHFTSSRYILNSPPALQ